jgi:hypothetical protein
MATTNLAEQFQARFRKSDLVAPALDQSVRYQFVNHLPTDDGNCRVIAETGETVPEVLW